MTKIIEAINKSFSRFIEPKWTRWTEEQPEERGRWTSLSKLLGGGQPPRPLPVLQHCFMNENIGFRHEHPKRDHLQFLPL